MKGHRNFHQRGVVLLGVIILAALLLIGAATIGIIYVRQLNQQRQVQTQGYLETAFQGLFPGNLRRRANLYSDFGYDPNVKPVPPLHHDLKLLVDRGAIVNSDTVPAHANAAQWTGTSTATTATLNAWNGPYWNGPVDGQSRPVDGWGRALQLRYISTSTPPGWQVFSVGANGVSQTGDTATPSGDDQVFPATPYVPPVSAAATCSTPQITFSRGSSYNPAEDITLTITDGAGVVQVVGPLTVNNGGGNVVTFTLAATTVGTITITATSSKAAPHPHDRGPWGPKTYSLTYPACSPYTWDITVP